MCAGSGKNRGREGIRPPNRAGARGILGSPSAPMSEHADTADLTFEPLPQPAAPPAVDPSGAPNAQLASESITPYMPHATALSHVPDGSAGQPVETVGAWRRMGQEIV